MSMDHGWGPAPMTLIATKWVTVDDVVYMEHISFIIVLSVPSIPYNNFWRQNNVKNCYILKSFCEIVSPP